MIVLTLPQPADDEYDDDQYEEYHVVFLETRKVPSKSLQPMKQAPDFVATLVYLAVVFPRVYPLSQPRLHWLISQH